MQVLDDDNHADGEQAITRAGSCYALYAASENVVRPVGQYNEVRLVVHGAFVEHWLNGRKIVEYEIGSDDWGKPCRSVKIRGLGTFCTLSQRSYCTSGSHRPGLVPQYSPKRALNGEQ